VQLSKQVKKFQDGSSGTTPTPGKQPLIPDEDEL